MNTIPLTPMSVVLPQNLSPILTTSTSENHLMMSALTNLTSVALNLQNTLTTLATPPANRRTPDIRCSSPRESETILDRENFQSLPPKTTNISRIFNVKIKNDTLPTSSEEEFGSARDDTDSSSFARPESKNKSKQKKN